MLSYYAAPASLTDSAEHVMRELSWGKGRVSPFFEELGGPLV